MLMLKTWRPWLVGAVVLSGAATYIAFVRAHWMPAPNDSLERYVCPDKKTVIHYRHHASVLRIETPIGTRAGYMHYDQIEWEDRQLATVVLGFPPPTHIKYGDLHVVRLGGGQLDDVECRR